MKRTLVQLTAVVLFASVLALDSAGRAAAAAQDDSQARPQARRCSDATLKGRYAVHGSGTLTSGGAGHVSFVGLGEEDGGGGGKGGDTASLNGEIFRRAYAGSYQVKDDCTGSITFVLPPPRNIEIHFDLVIAAGGDEAFAIETDSGTNVTAVIKRQ